MLTNACKVLAKHWLSRHHPTFGAAYILDTICYESPKKKIISHAFKHLIHNIKSYNEDKI